MEALKFQEYIMSKQTLNNQSFTNILKRFVRKKLVTHLTCLCEWLTGQGQINMANDKMLLIAKTKMWTWREPYSLTSWTHMLEKSRTKCNKEQVEMSKADRRYSSLFNKQTQLCSHGGDGLFPYPHRTTFLETTVTKLSSFCLFPWQNAQTSCIL